MFMCVVNLKSVNKLDLTWKQSFLIMIYGPDAAIRCHCSQVDLAGLDCVLGIPNLVRVDGSCGVNCPGVLC